MRRWLFILLACSFALNAPEGASGGGEGAPEARAGFRKIEDLYSRWNRGWFGSRHYYGRKLRSALVESLGARLETDANYLLIYPESLVNNNYTCRLYYGGWCVIRGEAGADALRAVAGDKPGALHGWWRTGRLCSLSGTLKRFAVDELDPRRVVLFLDGITIRESVPGK